MRHGIKGKKLNVTAAHRRAMFRNMSVSIIMHEQIKTTLAKAKAIRPVLEKLVTKAKRGQNDLSTRRYLLSSLCGDDIAVNKLLNVIAQRYKDRPGGYLRIVKAGFRFGDMAEVAYIEFVDRDLSAKGFGAQNAKEHDDSHDHDHHHHHDAEHHHEAHAPEKVEKVSKAKKTHTTEKQSAKIKQVSEGKVKATGSKPKGTIVKAAGRGGDK
jgi:large subunit ribosomal protein L17